MGALPPLFYLSFFLFLPIALLVHRFYTGGVFELLKEYSRLVYFNLFQASLSAFIATSLGLMISYILARKRLPQFFRSIASAVSKVSFVIPGVSMAVGFFLLLGRRGFLNTILAPLGLRVDILYTFWAVIIGHAFYNIPVTVFIAGNAWEKLDGRLIEASKVDGAGPWRSFLKIELPLLAPSIIASYLLSFVYCFTSFAVVMILGGVRYSTLEVAIYMYMRNLQEFNVALALTFVQMVIVAGVAMSSSLFSMVRVPIGSPHRTRMNTLSWFLFFVPLSFIAFPLILSMLSGFIYRGGSFSLKPFELLFKRGLDFLGLGFFKIVLYTVFLGVAAASVSVAAALFISYFSSRGVWFFKVLSVIPSAVSTVTLSMGYILISLYFGFNTISLIPFLHSVLSIPIVVSILDGGWRTVPNEVIEASKVDGASSVVRLFKIYIPLLKSFILRAFAFSMAISFSDLGGVLMLSERGFMTLSMGVYRLMGSRHMTEAKALNTILMGLVLMIFLLIESTLGEED